MALHFLDKVREGYREWAEMPQRNNSVEHDFGAQWTVSGKATEYPRWRVSWNQKTGELYSCSPRGRYTILAIVPELSKAQEIMGDWANEKTPYYRNLEALSRHIMAQGYGFWDGRRV